MIVDGVRQDSESIVEEKDESENDADEEAKLTAGSYLGSLQHTIDSRPQVSDLSYNSSCHSDSPEPREVQGGPFEDTSAD